MRALDLARDKMCAEVDLLPAPASGYTRQLTKYGEMCDAPLLWHDAVIGALGYTRNAQHSIP
jgi:hypothetical protein